MNEPLDDEEEVHGETWTGMEDYDEGARAVDIDMEIDWGCDYRGCNGECVDSDDFDDEEQD